MNICTQWLCITLGAFFLQKKTPDNKKYHQVLYTNYISGRIRKKAQRTTVITTMKPI